MSEHVPLLDAEGQELVTPQPLGMNARRLFFDSASVVALVLAGMTYATLAGDVRNNTDDIKGLLVAKDVRAAADVRIAETMATKADVQRVSDQVQALAQELRSARAGMR